jgi:hypothetical protein
LILLLVFAAHCLLLTLQFAAFSVSSNGDEKTGMAGADETRFDD